MPCNTELTEIQRAALIARFPSIDVEAQLARMVDYLQRHPNRNVRNFNRFASNWLKSTPIPDNSDRLAEESWDRLVRRAVECERANRWNPTPQCDYLEPRDMTAIGGLGGITAIMAARGRLADGLPTDHAVLHAQFIRRWKALNGGAR